MRWHFARCATFFLVALTAFSFTMAQIAIVINLAMKVEIVVQELVSHVHHLLVSSN